MSHAATLPLLLKQLKLSSMITHWESYLEQAEKRGWNPAQYLAALCEEELNQRYSRRIARYFKESKLPVGKSLSSFDFSQTPDLAAGKIEALASDPSWVKRSENLLLFGPSGVGKTHLAVAICNGLIEQNVRVRYYQATALVQELQRARHELQLERMFARLDKYAIIILDDIGYVKKSETETHVLFELIAHRYESGSMIITANHPFGDWDQIFADTIMTVAAIDRLVHHAMIVEIDADSFRKKEAMNRNQL
ncbi:MAG: IS21-like element helper ATPase IstB [Desulfobulbaceae bacterium]|nr:IS21-like element helper ATPase IstB [Desulfobulbaceae bacterium]